jgi:rod shape-determining protein MreC
MRSLLNFLVRYNNLFIFLILEGIAFYLISTGNSYQNARLLNGVRGMTRGIEEKLYNYRSYLGLHEINERLAAENIALKNRIGEMSKVESSVITSVDDSVYKQQYIYTSAEVTANSVNKQKNFFTINKGSQQGIAVDMAVTSSNSVAGVIVGCSKNYSVAMSLLNRDFKLSARIRSNGYYGSLSWDGKDYRYAVLNEIPQHVSMIAGDTVEATGFSAIFPEGAIVGTVSDFEKTGGDFYKIRILLMTDFRKLNFVDVIGNMKKSEQLELEKLFQ